MASTWTTAGLSAVSAGACSCRNHPRNRAKPVSIWTWSKIVTVIAKARREPRASRHTHYGICV